MGEPRLDHVGLNVADLAAAEAWYTAAFSYEREFAARVEEIDLDVVMLIHRGRGDRLELLHRGGSRPGLRAADPAQAALSEAFGHIAFDVEGVDATFDRLVAIGARPVMAPRASPEPGVRMAFVADLEGNLVELLDRSAVRRFPSGFLWGVASAGHQNEGDNTRSDTWFAEHVSPTVFREPSGRACNGYELWRDDVDLAAGLGLTAYRFSVEWARVEPEPGRFDDDALAHYGAVVDRCRERGMAPIVTFNHFTAPHWFACRGSWLDAAAPAAFARYCDRIVDAFGERIAVAVTLNEPNLARLLTWVDLPPVVRDLERATLEAASRAAGVPRYRLANVMLPEEMDAMADGMEAGHRAARAAIKARRPDLPVGFSIALVDDRVVGDDASVRDRKRSEVYGRWLRLARDDDFVGVQNYESAGYDGSGAVGAAGLFAGIDPGSLAGAVRYAHEEAGVPVLVTEHGMATADDTRRDAFLEPSLAALAEAVEGGIPVLGYCHWTLMDNFEWIFGYGQQLGLHEVDRTTFARTPKPSARRFATIARANAVGGT